MIFGLLLGNIFKTIAQCLSVLAPVLLLACGQQPGPMLQAARSSNDLSENTVSAPDTTSVLRSNSDEDNTSSVSSGSPVRVSVFSRRIEPLNLQKGGTAKIALPFSDEARLLGNVRAIMFVSPSAALKQSSIQGRTLSIVVAEDASEGPHEGRVVVRFENGPEFSHPLSISVLP